MKFKLSRPATPSVFGVLRGHRQGETKTLSHALLQFAGFAVARQHVRESQIGAQCDSDTWLVSMVAMGSRP